MSKKLLISLIITLIISLLVFTPFSPATAKRTVTFRLDGFTGAGKVTLAGEFNGWKKDDIRLEKTNGGWETTLKLEPGTYEYKFIVDGNWDKANKDNRKITVGKQENTAKSTGNGKKGTTFRLDGFTGAGKVTLAGEFNGWKKDDIRLEKTNGGWETTLKLEPGNYEYKFIVDGNWDKANKDNRKITVEKQENAAKSTGNGKKGTTFRLDGFTGAGKVTLAGEFNGWKKDDIRLEKTNGGWETTLKLEPGNYEYKFIVDGNWDKANKDNRKITVKDKHSAAPESERDTQKSIANENTPRLVKLRLEGFLDASSIIVTGNFNWRFLKKKTKGGKQHFT